MTDAAARLARSYARDRDIAFMAFVGDGDFAYIDALTEKYALGPIPHTDVGAASVYKAVQECSNIPESVKTRAFIKCVETGFLPFMGGLGEAVS